MVAPRESGALARIFIDETCREQEIAEALDLSVTVVQGAVRPVQHISPAALELIEKNIDKVQRHHIDLLADEATRTPPEGQLRIVRKIWIQNSFWNF